MRLRDVSIKFPELQVLFVAQCVHAVPISHGSRRFIYPELQSNFDVVMSQSAALSGELDALHEPLTRLQSSANQALAELHIQKRERLTSSARASCMRRRQSTTG